MVNGVRAPYQMVDSRNTPRITTKNVVKELTRVKFRKLVAKEKLQPEVLWIRHKSGKHIEEIDNCRSDLSKDIPSEYKDFEELFQEESDEEALVEHQPWDHEIKLKEGKTPTKQKIYPLSEDKLEALRTYLEENRKKGFIQESTSPAGYPILFVKKKDGSLRLCVDY